MDGHASCFEQIWQECKMMPDPMWMRRLQPTPEPTGSSSSSIGAIVGGVTAGTALLFSVFQLPAVAASVAMRRPHSIALPGCVSACALSGGRASGGELQNFLRQQQQAKTAWNLAATTPTVAALISYFVHGEALPVDQYWSNCWWSGSLLLGLPVN